MSLVADIAASYRRPGQILQKRLTGAREADGLAILLFACLIAFVSQVPDMATRAQDQGVPTVGVFAGTLFAVFLIAPLMFYSLSIVIHLFLLVFLKWTNSFSTRYAVFWSLAVVSPLVLMLSALGAFGLHSSVLNLVGLAVGAATILFLTVNIRAAHVSDSN
jgi:hypothetical protein